MANDLSPEEWQVFLAHLNLFSKAKMCPICGQMNWGVPGLELGSAGPFVVDSVTPAVVMVCNVCFYMQRFAWLGIKRAAEEAVAEEAVKLVKKMEPTGG